MPTAPLRQVTIEVAGDAVEVSRVNISGNKIDGYAANWQVNDQIGVCLISDGVEQLCNHPLTATAVDSEGVASFSATISSDWTGQGVLYSYYPYSPNAHTQSPNMILGEVPTEQTMTEDGSFDSVAAYMVGQPAEVELSDDSRLETATKFRFLNSFVNLSCKSISVEGVSEDDIVERVRLRVEEKCLAGEFALNLATGECAFSNSADWVSVDVPSGMTLGGLSAWLVVTPFELTPTDQMIIEVETADYIISKCITERTINFGMRQVITLNLGIDENCDVTIKENSPCSVTYNISSQSTSAVVPFEIIYTGAANG
ncbi:MAG: hypothetical protein IKV60_04020, partial [Rikenellaceae bacterium]|nr:hypothetical protein [Rikenellaceae bacterium]